MIPVCNMCTTYPPREPFWGPFWGPFPEGISLAGMFGETLISRVVSSMLSEMSFCVVLVTPLKGLNQGLDPWPDLGIAPRSGWPNPGCDTHHPGFPGWPGRSPQTRYRRVMACNDQKIAPLKIEFSRVFLNVILWKPKS